MKDSTLLCVKDESLINRMLFEPGVVHPLWLFVCKQKLWGCDI